MNLRALILLNILSVITISAFCEYFIYKIVLHKCTWPDDDNGGNNSNNRKKVHQRSPTQLRAFFIADPHLLGPFRGHWFDKLRREWQMQMSFQTGYNLLKPDKVFILGDLFDEGEIVNEEEWNHYMDRFQNRIFRTSEPDKLRIIVGNHDIGFHGTILHDIEKWLRFKKAFGIESSVNLMHVHDISFLTINSMAMKQDDGCTFCRDAEKELHQLGGQLNTREEKSRCDQEGNIIRCKTNGNMFVLQHFPLYRKNEAACSGEDGPPQHLKSVQNKENWDVLSRKSTEFLLSTFNPALVLSGHAHHGCFVNYKGTWELSVPSFSWRNRNNPSLVMAVFTNEEITLQKCYLPKESTVITIYVMAVCSLALVNMTQFYRIHYSKPNRKMM